MEGDWAILCGLVLAYISQWLRGWKKCPNIVAAGIMVGFGIALYILGYQGPITWTRQFFIGGITWLAGIRGFASFFGEVKAAPATNTVG